MTWARGERRILLVAIGLALALRLALTFLNDDANDDHLPVIDAIVRTGNLPASGICFECYHPKLFHASAAAVAHILGLGPASGNATYRLPAQILSSLAGFLMLWAGRAFIWEATPDRRTRYWSLALLVCNAPLAGISVQATNDSFVILFGSLALLFAARLTRIAPSAPLPPLTVAFASGTSILAALSKANGIVIFASVAALFAWRTLARIRFSGERRTNLIALALLCLPFFAVVPFAGQYVQAFHAAGTPFGNVPKNSPPGLCSPVLPTEPGGFNRPGVLSVCEGYFTFDLPGILRHPYIESWGTNIIGARSSLWTQLYARSHFLFFEQWPPRWAGSEPWVLNLGRATLSLCLLPAALALLGLGLGVASFFPRGRPIAARLWSAEGAAVVPALAMLAAFAALNYQYRDHASMKAIYVFPVMFSALWCFQRGATAVRAELAARGMRPALVENAIGGSVVGVCGLYVGALAVLAWRLHTKT